MICGIWITPVLFIHMCTILPGQDLSSNCRLAPPAYSILAPKKRANGPMVQHHTKVKCTLNATRLRIRRQISLLLIVHSQVEIEGTHFKEAKLLP